ncbi:MAG: hypothetical protein U9O82_03410 [Thermodesulfobacteriota bacterium]|nr:hypothetical protein [Thermodesulfobacteriota bacterium]
MVRIEKEEDFNREELKKFDCGNSDLNDFFRNDAFAYNSQLLATTYYFQPRVATEENNYIPVAFVGFLNDSIDITQDERKKEKKAFFKILRKMFPFPKWRSSSCPAVKIGRLVP